MSELQLPPSEQIKPPKWLQFPRDMTVNPDLTPSQYVIQHDAVNVWLWIRHPLVTLAQPFAPEMAIRMGTQMIDHGEKALEASMAAKRLVEMRAPIFGPNGEVIG